MFALIVFIQLGFPIALVLLILGLCLRRRSMRKSALIVFVCSCILMITAMLCVRPGPLRDEDPAEIDEAGSDYFVVGVLRYEALEITQTYEIQTNEWSAPIYKYNHGFADTDYYQVPNSEGYDIVKSFGGKLYCRAEQKAEILAFLSDTEHPVWYGIRTDGNTHRLSDELVAEVLDFCKSAEGTEEIYLSDCKNITLTKTIGGIIDQGSVFLQLYGGQAYYGVDGAMAPLPADLSNRLVTALDN